MKKRDMFKRFLMGSFIVIGLLAFAGNAMAIPITGLFTTGVDASGVALGDSAADPHYTVFDGTTSLGSAVTIKNSAFPTPTGTWLANNATSRWIWENDNGTPTSVTRIFRTTFTLAPGLDPSTAEISGKWLLDNLGLDIVINTTSTGITLTPADFTTPVAFTISSGFMSGLNTLDFKIQDVGGISGFRVTEISGSVDPVPEPATMFLLGSGLVGFAGLRRKKFKR